jgi:hypothetical protein
MTLRASSLPAGRVAVSHHARAALAVATALLVYNLTPLAFGTNALLARVPDDAFYYLILAKNFAAKGVWTFDGAHAATGFHLLYGYMLALMYALFPNLSLTPAYILIVIVNVMLMGFGLYLLLKAVSNAGLETGLIGPILVGLSPASFRLAGYPMESALAVFFGCGAMLLATPAAAAVRRAPVIAFGTGLLGVLARSDLGAMPFALLAGALLTMYLRRAYDARLLAVLAAMCAGAICGEAVVSAHTYFVTGGFVQRSASIKFHWAKVSGFTVLPGIARIAELMGPHVVPRPVILLALALASALVLWRGQAADLLKRPLVPGALLICAGYVAVYALNGSVQYWYAANFFAAAGVLAAVLWSSLVKQRAFAGAAAIGFFLASAAYQQAVPPWPWAVAMREGGEYLKAHPEISPVGSWNAGIATYFADRPVVNLDGLVNDDVYSYVAEGRLAQYLVDRDIRYLADFTSMLDEGAGRRGGYTDGVLASCAKPLKAFAPELRFNGEAFTLMEAGRECLAKPAR